MNTRDEFYRYIQPSEPNVSQEESQHSYYMPETTSTSYLPFGGVSTHSSLTGQVQPSVNRLLQNLEDAKNIDDQVRSLLSKEQTWMQRLFPNEMDKVTQEVKKKLMQASVDSQIVIYRVAAELKQKAFSDTCNTLLGMLQAQHRAALAEFIVAKNNELHRAISRLEMEIMDRSAQQLDRAKRYSRHPTLQNTCEHSINYRARQYVEMVLRLQENFLNIINEQIKLRQGF